MILTLDNSTLTLMINPGADPPDDPETGQPLTHAKERIEGLIESLGKDDRILIPAPVLAEVLVTAEEGGPEILEKIQSLARFEIAPFDTRAAVELAAMTREAIQTGSKKGGSSEPWQKVKFDRQIIAISRVARSDQLFSDDGGLCAFAQSIGEKTISSWELAVPEHNPGLFD